MERSDLTYVLMLNPSWRDAINFLCDLLTCTRYEAARLLATAVDEGYLHA